MSIKNQDKKKKDEEIREDQKTNPRPENTSKRENAINKREVDGKDINHQVEEKREQHTPRDTA